MKSAGANDLVAAVEKTTGYRVVVDTVDNISEDAQMLSARPELPVHTIRVSKAKLPYAEYIVATQCAMILRTWADPTRIPAFSPITEKVGHYMNRTASAKPLSQAPASVAQKTAQHYVQGLLHQVRSMPLEILTIRDCRELCPDLRDLQADSVENELRRLSEVFAPKLRSSVPEQIWRGNVSMNSAFALNWAELSGSPLAMLPYNSAGFNGTGTSLLKEVNAHSAKTPDAYMALVDAWAEQVGLRTLYQWEYRNAKS
jgi:hypothetical protein